MPESISNRSDIEAVEIDTISGNILKLLYPDAKVNVQDLKRQTLKMDLLI